MAARTLYPRSSLINLLGEIRYTLSRLQVSPAALAHVPAFQALRDQWTGVQAQEITIQESLSDAKAQIDAADDALDDFADRLSKAVLTITKDDRTHALYVHFFGKKTLNEFKRPVLRGQLEAMRAWVKSLKESPHASLSDEAALAALEKQMAEDAARRRRSRRSWGRSSAPSGP